MVPVYIASAFCYLGCLGWALTMVMPMSISFVVFQVEASSLFGMATIGAIALLIDAPKPPPKQVAKPMSIYDYR